MKAGIESLSFYVPHYYLDLKTLARVRGVDPEKFYKGIGQERMAVPAPDEDVVTMGANAALKALEGVDRERIDTLMFATESGIDQSKAAGVYVHHLLDLPSTCKCFELKQACSSATAGLIMALALVRQYPDKKVLIIASDIARYGLGAAGEPTQGAGAVAMVISADPKIIAFDNEVGSYTEDVMDFWRPNYREEALVDGKYSIRVYLKALTETWKHYVRASGRNFSSHERYCYHLPFTRMAEKAHAHLAKHFAGADLSESKLAEQYEDALHYNRLTGNVYTASLYMGLASLLERTNGLEDKRIALFSYGSGCLAYFFSGVVASSYAAHVRGRGHQKMLAARRELTYEEYEYFYNQQLPRDGSTFATERHETGAFRLEGIEAHQRIYGRSFNAENRTHSALSEEAAKGNTAQHKAAFQ